MRSHVGPLSKLPVSPRLQSERRFAHAKWRFRKIGVPPVIIHFSRIFHYKPSIFGYPNDYGNPQILRQPASFVETNQRRLGLGPLGFPRQIARPRSWWCSPGELPPPPWRTFGSCFHLVFSHVWNCEVCFTCCLFVPHFFLLAVGIFLGLFYVLKVK